MCRAKVQTPMEHPYPNIVCRLPVCPSNTRAWYIVHPSSIQLFPKEHPAALGSIHPRYIQHLAVFTQGTSSTCSPLGGYSPKVHPALGFFSTWVTYWCGVMNPLPVDPSTHPTNVSDHEHCPAMAQNGGPKYSGTCRPRAHGTQGKRGIAWMCVVHNKFHWVGCDSGMQENYKVDQHHMHQATTTAGLVPLATQSMIRRVPGIARTVVRCWISLDVGGYGRRRTVLQKHPNSHQQHDHHPPTHFS